MKLQSLSAFVGLVVLGACSQTDETNVVAPEAGQEVDVALEAEDSGGETSLDGLAVADSLPTTKAVLAVSGALRLCSLWDLTVTSEGIAHAQNLLFESHGKKKKKDPPGTRYADSAAQSGNTVSMYNKTYRWVQRGKELTGMDAVQFDVVDGRSLTISGSVRACAGDMVIAINETVTATVGAQLSRTFDGERLNPRKPERRQAFLNLHVHQTLPAPPPPGDGDEGGSTGTGTGTGTDTGGSGSGGGGSDSTCEGNGEGAGEGSGEGC